jgi:predicted Zn-dependent protease
MRSPLKAPFFISSLARFENRSCRGRLVASGMVLVLTAGLFACATSPTGRKQLMLVGQDQVDQMGAQAFQQALQQTPASTDQKVNDYVNCVVRPLTEAAKDKTDVKQWNIKVLQSDQINAFALPGGEIGVYTGIFKTAKNEDQLATVVGHEIGHVIARHGAERVSDQLATQGGLSVAEAFLGGTASPTQSNLIMSALGMGAQVGVLLPFSRTQESEADVIGLQLMAQAGYDPNQAIALWQNMSQVTQGQSPPEFLSDHPADQKRIQNLEAHLNEAKQLQQQAGTASQRPNCTPPDS